MNNRNNITREEYLALAGQIANGLYERAGFFNDEVAQAVIKYTDELVQKLNERFTQEDFEPDDNYYRL